MRLVNWLFRSRTTGHITVAQTPNWPLGVWLGATALRWATSPRGAAKTGLAVIGTGALLIWAADEVVRGVNPWRRILGATVGATVIVGLVTRR